MKLHQSISYLTKQEQNDLRHIVKTLSVSLQPALLYCFGIRMSQQLHRSCFTQKRRNEKGYVIYDLLLILHDKDVLQDDMAASVAKRMIGGSFQTNILVHHFSFMKTQLLEMNFFFTWAHRSAILLINRDNSFAQLPPQNKKSDILPVSQQMHDAINMELDKAKLLLVDIHEQWTLQPYGTTLKMIQQTATTILKALMLSGLGYDAANCSVETMLKLSENFTTLSAEIFPNNTSEEKNIYSLLVNENIPGEIDQNNLLSLLKRIKYLKQKVHDHRLKNAALLKI